MICDFILLYMSFQCMNMSRKSNQFTEKQILQTSYQDIGYTHKMYT